MGYQETTLSTGKMFVLGGKSFGASFFFLNHVIVNGLVYSPEIHIHICETVFPFTAPLHQKE